MEIGSWAEVLGALGAICAAVVSVLALRTALAANRTAEHTRREAKEHADEMSSRDELRERAAVARQLQAWWVVWWPDGADGVKRFGIRVSNAGEGATVFRNVRIETCGNALAKGTRGDITFTTLPPGSYIIPSNPSGSERAWGDPEIAVPNRIYEPLIKAQKYAVTRISFEDPIRAAWEWTPEDGLLSREPAG